jgi:hypothetical protein
LENLATEINESFKSTQSPISGQFSTTTGPTGGQEFTTFKSGVSYQTTSQITTDESPKDVGGVSTEFASTTAFTSTSRSTFSTESPESMHSSTQQSDLFNQFSTSGAPEVASTTEFRPSVTTETEPDLSSQTMISQFESSTSQSQSTTTVPLVSTTFSSGIENQTVNNIKNDGNDYDDLEKPDIEVPPFEIDLFANPSSSTTEPNILTSTYGSAEEMTTIGFDRLTTPSGSSEEVTQGDGDDRFDISQGGGCDSDNDCVDYEACKENICVNPCLKPKAACALNARCSVANHTVQCTCPPGQLGDAHVDCRRGITQY